MADINKIQIPGITDPLLIKDDSGTKSDHKHTKDQITDFPTNHVTTDTEQTISGSKTFSSAMKVSSTNEMGSGSGALYYGDGIVVTVGATAQSMVFPATGGTFATTAYVDNAIAAAITTALNTAV